MNHLVVTFTMERGCDQGSQKCQWMLREVVLRLNTESSWALAGNFGIFGGQCQVNRESGGFEG